jgi:phage gpG-like protein
MIRISVTDSGVLASFDTLLGTLASPDLMEGVSFILLNRTRQRFLNEVGPSGVPWPRSRAAIERARQGRGGGTLFDTGRLFHSIQIVKITPYLFSLETDVPYAAEHQFKLRPFLGVNSEDIRVMSSFISRSILGAL